MVMDRIDKEFIRVCEEELKGKAKISSDYRNESFNLVCNVNIRKSTLNRDLEKVADFFKEQEKFAGKVKQRKREFPREKKYTFVFNGNHGLKIS